MSASGTAVSSWVSIAGSTSRGVSDEMSLRRTGAALLLTIEVMVL
jgi:hypothetical protein